MSLADDTKRSKLFNNSQLNNEEGQPPENAYIPVDGNNDRTVSAVDLVPVEDDDEILSTLSNRSDLS